MVRSILTAVMAAILVGSVANLARTAEEGTFEGTIVKIEGDKLTVKSMMKDNMKEQPMKIGPATKITSGGKPASVMDLKMGQKVKCLIQKDGDAMLCTSLEIRQQ